ncbi:MULTISPECIES: dTMP kinase [Prochlorococcus]|uniref:Thymidylate kinase n=1 Tax=Prochlorococcus marinus (strain SARG / CCMP1375 / SS120) TaxID=167539 RepID=KTHY_PROMA|nr:MULTISPECIES: dTMP kinase [Prochlorococcus]Q7VE61.1 RecName: Full=Thymidylate kinase; AltName: Full=dTMP kinase [Prochlorococcus marinus subsp. marinus str. CCMP1375]AAP99198.1 Thymidylate kinase [Prochlorococcus marinus subsp. marinus str. CCMP1375]KGG11534.1 Thymidylate kinase [Prochlorococcus marinus str. LG]KGG18512.1 Thymidylate kinase [Prochlorococcus marinus str. SS2]KGG22785.1 Thymidylate kinase [Prochlorococcus marinus str. SS35]KGG32662.1 Thymidylate kinase [Prochlorococcus marin
MKGIFLVLEGIDGCGKSTQIEHLAQWLPLSGLMPSAAKLFITREPGGTRLGKSLRQLLLGTSPTDESPKPLTELLLYAADRAQHVSQVIQPKINNGDWVISDRFSSSTLAYQGFGRRLDKSLIKELENIATQGITPDLTFLLEIPVSESIKRRENTRKDRIESEGEIFLKRVSDGFSYIAKNDNWLVIPANQKKDIVSKQIENKLINYFQNISSLKNERS